VKEKLIDEVEALRNLVIQRTSKQGLKIYEIALAQLRNAQSAGELKDIHGRLKDALMGIDTHGSFTQGEYEIVKRILEF
jgi:hypothetical protein